MPLASLIKRHFKAAPLFVTAFSTLPALMSLSMPSHSQTPEEVFNAYYKDWFQVEIIIFERLEIADEDPEAWPKNVELKYPSDIAFLVDPNAPVTDDEPESAEQESEQITPPEETTSGQDVVNNREFLELLKKSGASDAFTQKLLEKLSESEIARLTPNELPYQFLDEETQQLGDESRRLGRDRKMRLLFHEAWRQPFYAKEQAPSIVITGGDLFEDHYELEGSITLFLSRYLHIHTNLWLTQFDANTGKDEEHWRWLPDRPEPKTEVEATDGMDNNTTGEITFDTNLNTSNLNSTFDNNTFDSNISNASNGLPSFDDIPSLNMGFDSDSLDFNLNDGGSTTYFDDLGNFIEHPYVIRQIVSVKQQRRMRSGELHYIDHPRLGILIRIDPYQPEFNESAPE